MSIQITMLLFVTITLLAAVLISANSINTAYEMTTEADTVTASPSPTIDSGRNRTDYFDSTTLSTPAGNFSTINATFVPKRNQSSTPSYYYNLTTLSTPADNFSFTESATTAQPQSNSSVGIYQVENNKTDDDEYNEKKTIMEKSMNSSLERSQFSKFMNDPYDYNNTSNYTYTPSYYNNLTTPQTPTGNFSMINGTFVPKRNQTSTPSYYYNLTTPQTPTGNFSKFKPEIALIHRIDFEPQETTASPDFSDNQMLKETVSLTRQQYPNKFQVLFDLWLLDSGNRDSMGKFDWNNLSMSEIPDMIYDNSTLIQKKQTILNTFNVLSKFIEKYVSIEQPGSGSLLRFFNGSTTIQDLVMIANVKDFIQLDGKTNETTFITSSDQNEMAKHGQKVFRKIYTYTEEEITTQ